MTIVLPEVSVIDLRELYEDRSRLDKTKDGDLERLDRAVREQPPGSVVALDLRPLEYLGYSFAKRTLRKVLRRRNAGEYDDRQIILVAEQDPEFLDGTETALKEEKLFTLVVPDPDAIRRDQRAGQLLGAAPAHLEDTFDALRELEDPTTGELARAINESVQNTNNRLRRLEEMGLVRREKVSSPSGGREWRNRAF